MNSNKYLPLVNAVLEAETEGSRQRAFSQMYQVMKPLMAAEIQKQAHMKFSPSEQEMIVASAMSKILCGLQSGKYNPSFAFSTWAKRIAVNCFIDATRKHEMEPRAQGEAVPYETQVRSEQSGEYEQLGVYKTTTTYVNSGIVAGLTLRRAAKMVRLIAKPIPNEACKVAFDLRLLQGLTYDEIALKTNVPIGTVKARIHRGRKYVKDCLEAAGATFEGLMYFDSQDDHKVSPVTPKLRFTVNEIVENELSLVA